MRGGKSAKGGAKSKRPKAPPPTDAEMLELEYRAQEQRVEEMRRKLKEDFEEEMRMSRVNALKVASNWRTILRRLKTEELKREIDVLSQNHDRQVDRKDAVLQMLLRDVEVAEEQYRLALRSHLQNVDELIRLQQARIKALSDEYTHDVSVLQAEFQREQQEILTRHAREKAEIAAIVDSVLLESEEKQEFVDQEFNAEKEEITSKHTEVYHYLKVQLETEIVDLKEKLLAEHERNNNTTLELMNRFEILKGEDEETANDIAKKMRKLQRLSEEVSSWKAKLATNIRECESRNAAMRLEKDALSGHFKKLKAKMNGRRERQRQRLADLVTNSNGAIDRLKTQREQAERILKLAELNRKLETEREKIMPFYKETDIDEATLREVHTQEEFMEHTIQSEMGTEKGISPTPSLPLAQQEGSESQKLRNFYKRYNKVLLDKIALEQERKHLEEENAKLQTLLKQYLDGISVNEDVLAEANPLLMVQEMQRLPAAVGATGAGASRRNHVEANVVVNQYITQRR